MLNKLQERAKARQQLSHATKEESDVQDSKTSERSRVGKTKRNLERQEKEKKQPKKKRKESVREQDDGDVDVDDTPVEQADLGTSEQSGRKKKKKDKKGSATQEEKQHTGAYACINLPGK